MNRKTTEIDVLIGKFLKQRRIYLNLTQKQVADEMGFSFAQWQKYENGKNRISFTNVIKLCDILDFEVYELYYAVTEKSRKDKLALNKARESLGD